MLANIRILIYLIDQMFSSSGRTRRVTAPEISADVNAVELQSSAERPVQERAQSCPSVSYPEVRRKKTLMNGGFWKIMRDEKEFWNDGRWFFDDPFSRMYSTWKKTIPRNTNLHPDIQCKPMFQLRKLIYFLWICMWYSQ